MKQFLIQIAKQSETGILKGCIKNCPIVKLYNKVLIMCAICTFFGFYSTVSFQFQDPFELNLCITKGYLPPALENWKKHCSETLEITTKIFKLRGRAAASKGLEFLKIFELELESLSDIIKASR